MSERKPRALGPILLLLSAMVLVGGISLDTYLELEVEDRRLREKSVELRHEIEWLRRRPRPAPPPVQAALLPTFSDLGQPDGEIVYADHELGYAWINLGRNHGLRPKQRFRVIDCASFDKTSVVKAVIEVARVDDTMAACFIVDPVLMPDPVSGTLVTLPVPGAPIVKGDLIVSKSFELGR